jgi:hypothetical protein
LCQDSGPHSCFLTEARVAEGVGSFNPPFLFGFLSNLFRSSSNKNHGKALVVPFKKIRQILVTV